MVKTYDDLRKKGAIPGNAHAEAKRWGGAPAGSKTFVSNDLPEIRETDLDIDKIMADPVVVAFQLPDKSRLVVYAGIDIMRSLHVEVPEDPTLLRRLQEVARGTRAVIRADDDRVVTVRRVRTLYTTPPGGNRDASYLSHYLFEVE